MNRDETIRGTSITLSFSHIHDRIKELKISARSFRVLKGCIMAENNTATSGCEKQIWADADVLRGNMVALEYKLVVLS